MSHPSVAELMALAAGDAVEDAIRSHAQACGPCRRLAGLGDAVSARALVDLVTVDPALYHGREPIAGGTGGMGTAVRAWDRRLGREVVIKQIGAAGDAPEVRARLQARLEQEARVTARLDHPGIVAVHELGRWPDGEPFYTMPLVGGEPLDRAIAARRSFEARLALLPRVAAAVDAIAYAHDRRVVHRDLKPANVLLGPFGETVVIDWGLATDVGARAEPVGAARDAAPDLTELGVGTPAYMPPEQARGAAPDPRADVYALGATLYHVLAGAPPYGADARRRVLDGPPRPLADVAPDVPADLRTIVETAMAREPAARFASAVALSEELRRFLAGQLTRSHRYGPGELVRHWLRRHRTAVSFLGVAVIVSGAIGAWSVGRVIRARDRAEIARRDAEAGRRDAEAALGRSRALQASLLARFPTRRLEAMELAANAAAPALAGGDALPVELAQGLADVLGAGAIATPVGSAGAPSQVAVSPDGARIAVVDRGAISVWDARDGAAVATLATGNGALWARFVGDDRIAAWGLGRDVEVWPLTGAPVTLDAGAGTSTLVAVDGDRVITASGAGVLGAWDVRGGRLATADAGCAPIALDAAAGRVVVGCDDGVVAWEPATAAVVRRADGRAARHVELDAGGAWIYAVLDEHELVRWPVADPAAAATRVFADPAATVYRASPTPDGAAVSVSAGTHWFVTLDGGAPRASLVDPTIAPRARAWAGAWYRERAAVRIDPAIRDVALVLRGHRAFDQAYAAAALGGARVAIATSSGETWLWDSRLGVDAGTLPDHRAEVVGITALGDRVVTAGLDGTITATSLDGTIAQHAVAGSELLAWAPGVGGTRAGEVLFVDADGRVARRAVHGRSPVSAAAISADGATAASGALDGSIVVWSVADGAERVRLGPDRDAVAALAFVGGRLVTGHRSGAVRVRGSDGAVVVERTLDAPIARLLPDGDDHVAIATVGGTGQRLALDDGAVEPLAGAPIAGSAAQLVLATPAGEVLVRRGGDTTTVGRHDLPVSHAVLAPDGRSLWTGDVGGTVRAWDLDAARPGVVLAPGEGAVTAMAITGDGAWLIVGFEDGAVRVVPATVTAAVRRVCATLRDHARVPPAGLCP